MLTVQRKADPRLWSSELRCATGRSAIWWMLHQCEPSRVLMPSYVPQGVIEPVKNLRLPIEFYKLNADMTPDDDDLVALVLRKVDRPFVVVIQYFGFEYRRGQFLRHLLNERGGWLFEDCAQAFWAKAEHADFALWSLNKFMSTVDGAVLRSRAVDVHKSDQALLDGISDIAQVQYRAHLRFNAMLKGMNMHDAADVMNAADEQYEWYYSDVRYEFMPRRMTQQAEMVLGDHKLLDAERDVRFGNSLRYHAHVPSEFKLRKWCREALFAYPIVCPVPREAVAMELNKIGVAPATLVTKWDHIPHELRYRAEHNFISRHLLLPVDASVGQDDVIHVEEVLRSFAKQKEEVA